MLLAAVFADVLTPYGFSQTNLRERFIASNAEHWLGTDQLGRDLLTRILYGARISLYVGFGAVALGSLLATALGHLLRLRRRPRSISSSSGWSTRGWPSRPSSS